VWRDTEKSSTRLPDERRDTIAPHTLRDSTGREVVARFRRASLDDVPAIEGLIVIATRELGRGDYSEEQIEAALGTALGVDSQLVRDGTYFVAEASGSLLACGGWSSRKTLFGSDGRTDRQPELLDPARDGARIRAFFVHPDWARQGLGRRLLELCEAEARANGFRSAELMATLPGERLYRQYGYIAKSAVQHTLPGGLVIEFVPMSKRFAVEDGTAMEESAKQKGKSMDVGVILKRFESPDEIREMPLGRFEVIHLGGMTIGRATYQPGWKWSAHVGSELGASRCSVEHLGLVVSGVATAAFDNGRVVELRPGDVFYIPPEPHDSWVVGVEPYVSLHFLGADKYAAK
jgi:GNAT superfamily N-acetyltransferase